MSLYPFALDSDETIIRIDDNITELGGEAINQLRDAVFAMQGEMGVDLSGSLNSLADRLNISLNANGTLKQSALAAIGLVTLPIVDNQVAANAGIKEYKLALDHTTSDLYTLITADKSLLEAVSAFATATSTDFLNHLVGSTFLVDAETSARHVASHIDLNAIPSDPRDPFFSWTGLRDKNGSLRTATQVAMALLQINDDLTTHENATVGAHIAAAISVDVSGFKEIPTTANTVQKVIDYLENAEELNIGEHRAVQHSNGIPTVARSQSLFETDGYGRDNVVSTTLVNAYLVNPPANTPVDSNTVGDDIIKFKPTNTDFVFDAQFSQVRVGDILRINYGNGVSGSFEVESVRFTPGVEWFVRINGSNLFNAVDGYIDGYAGEATARIDRPQYDSNTSGVLALAAANSIPSTLYTNILGSVVVGHPRGATALGLGFDGNKLNSSHYKLWLQFYPTGNPVESTVSLPFIDVTGDAGISPGSYTLDKVVSATNDAFRRVGYNYRFIAFAYKGDFGLMLADPYGKASFAIINGSNATGTVVTDTYTQNVVADATDGLDAFGFGSAAAGLASPAYQATFADATAARSPTHIITPAKKRFFIADGHKLDQFAPTYLANADGYWPATITARISTGSSVEVTYKIDLNLCAAKLKAGKTLVVQPAITLTDANYSINDYGRFIIKEVNFSEPCGTVGAFTTITVINGVHANGNAIAFTSDPGLAVRIYFSEDSIGFNNLNIIDGGVTGINYHRFHEIYINNDGVTFSHERARMKADQAEAAPPTSLLRTDSWHIKEVSPKLRGYQDSTTSLNKYIRFYVTRYDSTSGEFDGYIGKRNPSTTGILTPGPITTSRKNVPTKFFDETYIDFIELEFKETAVGPTGTAVLSNNNPRYVDIEIFPSLRQNPENMLLGSCEVNWHPPSGQNIIQSVKDLRDFGSIGPEDFNNSAVEFLSSADRYLHENGVVRGFQYVPSGVVNNTGRLFFDGGIAIVNGKVITANNSSVIIPAISDGGVTGVTVNWAVCVNEFGYLVPIILTSSKDQIFAGVGSLYYVQSVTFDELVNHRKDLTLVAIVDAHIASITINDSDVHDARRFISNEGANHPFILNADDAVGNFHTLASLKIWLSYFNGKKNTVKVNGSFDITTSLDLTGFSSMVTIEGDGSTFNVTAPQGILIGNNVTLRGLNFVYTPTGTYAGYVSSSNGCIYALLSSSNLSNIVIENCNFSEGLSTSNRPPFISFQIRKGFVLNNVSIRNNTFTDTGGTTTQAAIAVVHDLAGSGTNSAAISDLFIERNICNAQQGIYVTSFTDSSDFLTGLGLNTFNVHISDNSCGKIGIINSLNPTTLSGLDIPNSIFIKNNRCKFIGALEGSMGILPTLTSAPSYGIGNIIIEGNSCHWIHILAQDLVASNQYADLKIINNSLTAYDNTFLNALIGMGTLNDVAIKVLTSYGVAQTNSFVISGNTINFGRYNATTYKYYTGGIEVQSSAVITNNIIRGLGQLDSGTFSSGIIVKPGSFSNGARHHIIQGNQIYRGSQKLDKYVYIFTSTNSDTGIITDNFFDSSTVDGVSDTVLVSTATVPIGWIIERNKNQTVTLNFNAYDGTWSVGNISDFIFGDVPSASDGLAVYGSNSSNGDMVKISYTTNAFNNARYIKWNIPLNQTVPKGANIVSASAGISASAVASTTSSWILTLRYAGLADVTSGAPTTVGTSISTLIATPSLRNMISGDIGKLCIMLSGEINSSSIIEITVSSISVTYRW